MYIFFVTNFLFFSSFQKPQFDYTTVAPAVGRFGPVSQYGITPSYQYGFDPMFQNRMSPALQIGMNPVIFKKDDNLNFENIVNPITAGRYYNSNFIHFYVCFATTKILLLKTRTWVLVFRMVWVQYFKMELPLLIIMNSRRILLLGIKIKGLKLVKLGPQIEHS